MSWKLKSESDLEQVFAETARGKETGRYRYCYSDGRTIETSLLGTAGRHRKARHPRQIPHLAIAVAVGAVTVEAIRLIVG